MERRKLMKRATLAILAIILSASSLLAQTTWKSDPVHSKVLFNVTYMVLTEVTGRFNEFEVAMTATSEDFTDATVTATVKAKSIDTDNERRDNHLKSPDFFDAEKYPDITFRSTSIEKTGKNTYKVKGDLTIRDVTKPIELDVRYFGQAKDPWGNTRAGFKATTSINRNDFNVRWNRVLDAGGWLVGENVDITFNVQLIKQKEKEGSDQ